MDTAIRIDLAFIEASELKRESPVRRKKPVWREDKARFRQVDVGSQWHMIGGGVNSIRGCEFAEHLCFHKATG
ncbi:MAG: hypothetical protein ACLQU1_18850 [Bryobacteraceae bacterium]